MKHKKKQKDSVTFRIVAASRDNPNDVQLNFQRVVTRNDINKGRVHELPDDVLNAFKPEDFGIHSKLEPAQKEVLCQRVYGSSHIPKHIHVDLGDACEARHTYTQFSDGDSDAIIADADEGSWDKDDHINQIQVLPNDGYNYEQHLRPIGGKGGVYIPSTDPQVHYMPEPKNAEEKELFEAIENAELYDEIEDEFADILGSPIHSDNEEERPAESTAYLPADIFAKTMAEYGDNDIGDICDDTNHITGTNDVEDFEDLLDEFLEDDSKRFLYLADDDDDDRASDDSSEEADMCEEFVLQKNNFDKDKVTQIIKTLDEEDVKIIRQLVQLQMEESRDTEPSDVEEEPRDEWDIETILTTKTNIYNHPCKIANPSVKASNRITLPTKVKDLMKALQLADENMEKHQDKKDENAGDKKDENAGDKKDENAGDKKESKTKDILRSVNTVPKPDETAQERKERKKSVKEARRAIRILKKEKKL